jgi:hypothetical protein
MRHGHIQRFLVAVVIVAAMVAIFTDVREGCIVATAKALAVFVAGGWGNGGTAEFRSSFRIRGAVVFEVAAASFDAIVEAPPLDIAELLGRRIPATPIMVRVIRTVSLLRAVLGRAVLGACSYAFPEVRKGQIVAATEAFAVFVAGGFGHRRPTELHRRVHVRGTVAFVVSAAGFDAIMESLPLNIAQLLGRRIPAGAILSVAKLYADLGHAALGDEQN